MAGVHFTAAEVIGPMAGFVMLAAVTAWFLTAILRGVSLRP
jgi:hypothetical protein